MVIYIYKWAGDVERPLHHTAVLGGDGMSEAREGYEEHVHDGEYEDDMLRNGDIDGEEREELGDEERGERMLRALANVPRNVVAGAGGGLQQGGRRQ